MDDHLTVRVSSGPDGALVALAGEVDRASSERLRTELGAAAAAHGTIVVDLTELGFLDSSGVAALFERVGAGDTELVAGPGCLVRAVLEITGLPIGDRRDPGPV